MEAIFFIWNIFRAIAALAFLAGPLERRRKVFLAADISPDPDFGAVHKTRGLDLMKHFLAVNFPKSLFDDFHRPSSVGSRPSRSATCSR